MDAFSYVVLLHCKYQKKIVHALFLTFLTRFSLYFQSYGSDLLFLFYKTQKLPFIILILMGKGGTANYGLMCSPQDSMVAMLAFRPSAASSR